MGKKILLLADIASPHTEKWAVALAKEGFSVGIFSLNPVPVTWHKTHEGISLLGPTNRLRKRNGLSKISYLLLLPRLLRAIASFDPDILHAHYASSYGLLGALSRFKPFFISAWGSDVFDFPKKSFLQRWILKFSLDRADRIFSTSWALKKELRLYTAKEIQVIPFGVNTTVFRPLQTTVKRTKLRIGLIKSIEDIYGISTILEAVALIEQTQPLLNFEVQLIGGGSRLEYYRHRCREMKLQDRVHFIGKVPYSEIVSRHQNLDIFLNMTNVDESFGVSVLEAMACGKPVVVSKVPGMLEIVKGGTGIIVDKENPRQLAQAILKLCDSRALRESMGEAGRKHVKQNYEFEDNLKEMVSVYDIYLIEKCPDAHESEETGLTQEASCS